MTMNKIFDKNRFGRYFATDLRSCTASYGVSFLLISLMGVIIYIGTVMMGLIFNGTWEGPDIDFRSTVFGICMFVLMVTMPVKCYGRITDKKNGRDWLMIPASGTEKFLSMVIMTIFIIPVSAALLYLGLDAILCAADITCGPTLATSIFKLPDYIVSGQILTYGDINSYPAIDRFMSQVRNPLLYADDIIGASLAFLLGAITFRKSKTAKTFIALTVIITALGFVMTPVLSSIFKDIAVTAPESPEALDALFNRWIFRHVALFDTLNDTIVNLILLAGIYFRIKTLKH